MKRPTILLGCVITAALGSTADAAIRAVIQETAPVRTTSARGSAERSAATERSPELRRELARAKQNHVRRMARIERLRQLALRRGQTDRLAALDELEAKQQQIFRRQTARMKNTGSAPTNRAQNSRARAVPSSGNLRGGPVRSVEGRRGAGMKARTGPTLGGKINKKGAGARTTGVGPERQGN